MKVAVIGAGLFGCTAAIHAARAGHDVTLYDKASEVMTGATRANQLRLHRGYHYPRSASTVEECRQGLASFWKEYADAVVSGGDQYYAIAKGSRTSVDDYIRFMDEQGLEWHLADTESHLFSGLIEAAFKVPEQRIDYHKLRSIVELRLARSGVSVRLGKAAEQSMRGRFDRIIIAGYAGTNEIASALGCPRIELQYEMVEKPIVQLPKQYRDIGVVVMDGPFGCIDPTGQHGMHLMGHVEYAVRYSWTGTQGRDVEQFASAFEDMAAALTAYLPFMSEAEHVGSYRTVRVVLPAKDATDERPTLVTRLDDQVMRIFAGKLGHAVTAAKDALSLLGEERIAA